MRRLISVLALFAMLFSVTGAVAQERKGKVKTLQSKDKKAATPKGLTASEGLLVGSWKADLAATAAKSGKALDPQAIAMLGQMDMRASFTKDHALTLTMSMMGKNESKSGTWRIVSTTGSSMVLETTSPEQKVEQVTVVFSGTKATPSMTLSQGKENIIFNKVP